MPNADAPLPSDFGGDEAPEMIALFLAMRAFFRNPGKSDPIPAFVGSAVAAIKEQLGSDADQHVANAIRYHLGRNLPPPDGWLNDEYQAKARALLSERFGTL